MAGAWMKLHISIHVVQLLHHGSGKHVVCGTFSQNPSAAQQHQPIAQ
jgi:hypothetical protein